MASAAEKPALGGGNPAVVAPLGVNAPAFPEKVIPSQAARDVEAVSGADRLMGDGQANRIAGGDGNDRVRGGACNDQLDGGNDPDRPDGGANIYILYGGDAGDTFTCATIDESIAAPRNHRRLPGQPGPDSLTDIQISLSPSFPVQVPA